MYLIKAELWELLSAILGHDVNFQSTVATGAEAWLAAISTSWVQKPGGRRA